MSTEISDQVYKWCREGASVTENYSKEPKGTIEKCAANLFGSKHASMIASKPPKERETATKEQLQRALECGKFGETRPSDLFLRIYYDALCTLNNDPLVGVVSPSLMGTYGTVPLTVIAPLPEICRHMANLIVRAEKEVYLATNYWKKSGASMLLSNAIRELNERAGKREQKVVVKVMYDRGHLKQIYDNHAIAEPAEFAGRWVNLPEPSEIPNICLEVMNYHRPALGTFHAKYMVVDRKIGLIQSNNIQDNDNLEMMVQVEGPIVDSLYDMSLITWDKEMNPPLPCLNDATCSQALPTFQEQSFWDLFEKKDTSTEADSGLSAQGDYSWVDRVLQKNKEDPLQEHTVSDAHWDDDLAGEIRRIQSVWSPNTDGETWESVTTKNLNKATNLKISGTAHADDFEEVMVPYIPHNSRKFIPMALINRKPWGAPNHSCVYTPQNEAWLSAIRNARTNVFIQSPDVNAEPLIPALLDAVRRGVEVAYYACMGYNDAGEMLPYQGGINEVISNKLYTSLNEEERKRLHVHFYVAKDQDRPIHNSFKHRSCHIKLLVVDEHIGIQGSGNQDTQSWYHSQEVNFLIDSYEICSAWLKGIRRNQNTHHYGVVSQVDGVWRDSAGKEAPGSLGIKTSAFNSIKGFKGALLKAKGA